MGGGAVAAVLIKVRRRTETQDGYSGPSFLDTAEGVDMSTHAIVAITWFEDDTLGKKHTRKQLPMMLAYAVTVRLRHARDEGLAKTNTCKPH